MKSYRVKQLLIGVKVIVTILFVWVVNKTLFTTREPLSGLLPVDLLLESLFLSLCMTLILSWRWHLFLKIFGIDVTFAQSLKSYLEGVLFAVITPGRAGELLRGYSLDPQWLKMSSIAVVVERIWAMVVLFLFGIAFLPQLPGDKGGELYRIAIVVVGTLALVATFVIPIVVKRFRASARKVHRGFLYTFLLSIFHQGLLVLQFSLLIYGRMPLKFGDTTAAVASAQCGMQFIPVTVANMGVREFNLHHFISLYLGGTVPAETVTHVILSTSLIIVIANLLFPAVPGIVVLLLTKIRGIDRRK